MATVTNQSSVWHATSHPIRRRLIELLRDGPRTTGDLSGAFTVSRFAVMKHLRVLEEAGVVAVRREGRSSWHELTPGPLAELDRRWPGPQPAPPVQTESSPDAGSRVEAGLAAGGRVDSTGATAPPPQAASVLPRLFEIRLELFLDVEPARVFDALTFDMSAWWGVPYLRSPRARRVIIEALPGGRFLEEWGHRQGALRGIVTAVEQDRRLEVTGGVMGAGPFQSVIVFSLVRREGGTLLEFEHRGALERDGDAAACEAAWKDLLGRRLKAFVERGERTGIGPEPGGEPGGQLRGSDQGL